MSGSNPYHDEKLFRPYHLQRARALTHGAIPPPSTIEIDVTDEGCNQACVHCCFGSSSLKAIRQIDIDHVVEFVEEAHRSGVRAVELVGGGEPTTHRQFGDLVERLAAIGGPGDRLHIGLVTNGLLWKRILPVAKHIEWIRISLDSADPSVYARLHGVPSTANQHARVITGIETLVRQVGKGAVRIGYLVVPPFNNKPAAIADAVALAERLNVNHIAFRPVSDNPNGYDGRHADWPHVAATIRRLAAQSARGFVIGGIGGSWDAALGNSRPGGPCRTRPLVMVIKADGTVPSCILFRERLDERPALGNISDGFGTLWFSQLHQESLQAVDRAACPSICKHFRADAALGRLESMIAQGQEVETITPDEVDNELFI